MSRKLSEKAEAARREFLGKLDSYLDLARTCCGSDSFMFSNTSYYGDVWRNVRKYLETSDSAGRSLELTREVSRVSMFYDSAMRLIECKYYFDEDYDIWPKKIMALFEATNESQFDAKSYEFHIGSQFSMLGNVFFCDINGGSQSEEFCEYYIDCGMFLECKNLIGSGKNAIPNNIRKANSQIRETMRRIQSPVKIGVICIDIAEETASGDFRAIQEKTVEVLSRLRQCDSVHFIVVTNFNLVTLSDRTEANIFQRLVANREIPAWKNQDLLNLFRPKFATVLLPSPELDSFNEINIQSGTIVMNKSYNTIFQ